MRIAFVWDWENDFYQCMTWKDGLSAAMRELSQRHDVRMFTCGKKQAVWQHDFFDFHVWPEGDQMKEAVQAFKPDVILNFADCTRPNAESLAQLGKPQALCFAGGDPFNKTHRFFDHFFVESMSYKERFEAHGDSVSTAFGTNTDLFVPIPKQNKGFDVIFPATYCEWKRHRLLIESLKGFSVVTAGFMYPVQERDCWENCQEAGFLTLPHVSGETLKHLYAASKVCVITSKASGGSQRTVLEAMAMGLPVVVCSDSDKTSEYVREGNALFGFVGIVAEPHPEAIKEATEKALTMVGASKGREYVLSKWTHSQYAKAIEEGLEKLCKKTV